MSEPYSPVSVRFRDFELIPQLRRLERDGAPVELSSRATDILCLLAERPGQIVTKRELLARVWPDMVVDEGSIRFHIAALRRVLGDGEAGVRLIATVPGRGYCFVGSDEGALSPGAQAPSPHGLPAPPGRVVGREGVVEDLADRLARQQFVTLVGAGGLGKTTVALLAAHYWSEAHREPVTYVDLGAVTTDALDAVADAVAATLGLAGQAGKGVSRVIDHLRQQRHLLVLDTCEATIEGAARFAEAVFAAAPKVRVLAASREALRIEGEWVYRLESLAPPGEEEGLSAADALRFPAVQLFVQRAAASQAGFALHDDDAPLVSAICRDLGGMALALELAAGRVEAYGVRQVAELLRTRFALTWPGRRTALPRHQTLLATLEWSHDLLSPIERIVFRRLSVFVGAFTLDRAVTLLSPELSPDATVEALSSLVGRSLIHIETGQTSIRYRLLDSTRAFAELKLAEADEEQPLRRGHALLYQAVLAQERDAAPLALRDELSANLRAALTWAFGPHGDGDLGVAIAGASSPLWVERGLLFENRTWTHKALGVLDAGADSEKTLKARLALMSALLVYDGLTEDVHRSWRASYDAAERLGLKDIQLSGLSILWGHSFRIGHYRAAEVLAKQGAALVQASGGARANAPWMLGICSHYLGRQAEASALLECMLKEDTEETRTVSLRRFGYDREVAALRFLSNARFLEGRGREAARVSDEAIAKAAQRPLTWPLYDALAWRLFNVFYAREGAELDRRTTEIIEEGSRQGMVNAVGTARTWRGLWLCDSGDLAQGAAMVRQGMRMLADTNNFVLQPLLEAELHLRAARRARDISLVESDEVPWRENDPETWVTPEIRRIEGELAALAGDLPGAQRLFGEAEAMARRQGAARWRLRAALSAAELDLRCERPLAAAKRLAPVLKAFSADEVDEDLLRARQLVASPTSSSLAAARCASLA